MEDLLLEETRERIRQIGQADILVGIPSYNNERTIGRVVSAIQYGLAKYFPHLHGVIINSDGNSTDRTRLIVEQTNVYDNLDLVLINHPVQQAKNFATPYRGIPGKGSAFKAIFQVAKYLEVKACMVVDSDLRSISPEWVELLVGPILHKHYDYVAPYYSRHKYDGTITNSLVYPLTRALYGKVLRQPIGGDFGLSGRLAEFYLKRDVWESDVARYGIDIWMTTTAINENFRICQSFLGAKIHDAKDPSCSLGPMFKQVVGTCFSLMRKYQEKWRNIGCAQPVSTYGFDCEVSPEPISVNTSGMIEGFRKGWAVNRQYCLGILPEERVKQVDEIAGQETDKFIFPVQLWIRIIYDFALVYRNSLKWEPKVRDSLLESMVPIYFGRVASFVRETANLSNRETEQVIEQNCTEFENLKPYLVERWFSKVSRIPEKGRKEALPVAR